MFSNYYILFFFDQGLIVFTCFFLFLFFAILSEKGQLTASLQGPSEEARSKLSRPLSIRADALRAAVRYLNNHIDKNKKIAGSYGNALIDVTL